jgi:hypothetical protein
MPLHRRVRSADSTVESRKRQPIVAAKFDAGAVSRPNCREQARAAPAVKILARGDLGKALTVRAQVQRDRR